MLLNTPVGKIGLQLRQPSRASTLRTACSVRKARSSRQGTSCHQKQAGFVVSPELLLSLRSYREEDTDTTSTSRQLQAVARSGAALLIAGGLLLGTPSLTPPAQAESAAETRRAAAEQRRALLNKTCACNAYIQPLFNTSVLLLLSSAMYTWSYALTEGPACSFDVTILKSWHLGDPSCSRQPACGLVLASCMKLQTLNVSCWA